MTTTIIARTDLLNIDQPTELLPPVEHDGAEWCEHSICEAMRDLDGSITSLKTLFVFEDQDGERVEVVRRDAWTAVGGWKTGTPGIAGLSSELLMEHGAEIVTAALRVGIAMGQVQG
ncbi:hypothetical protein MUY14_26370 [Amycolatopsis sp. FBCC-B4732]|uniref:hypothetical protein n=1 Tax=Amycolatopsis sp. FBCC-B4732 TaxID=3079339 RepID=UPI001FF29BA0|nr:hypothetical protein [Amycolatopsis sp. FBCC-B4732]UOX85317.1 hypothetical protein MUY14_26370 [Amycolatopsis sp. FBCC-B4732]